MKQNLPAWNKGHFNFSEVTNFGNVLSNNSGKSYVMKFFVIPKDKIFFSLKSDLNLHFHPIVVIGSPWKQKRNKSENLSKLPPTLMVILMGVKQ